MKKALIVLLTVSAFACKNPEDGATSGPTPNSTPDYKEQTLNTPPGATTGDTSGTQRREQSKVDTSAKH